MHADSAVEAAERGFYVFPCRQGSKEPAVPQWEQRAMNNPARVKDAFTNRFQGCNYGIACGPSNLVVIDLDDDGNLYHGMPAGGTELALVCIYHGEEWPDTWTVRTRSGGLHLYYTAPEDGPEIRNSASRIAPMVDVRAAGGFVVGPGSVIDGRVYEVDDFFADFPIEPLPGWLADVARPARKEVPIPAPPVRIGTGPDPLGSSPDGVLRFVATLKKGQRNNGFHWAACRFAELITMGDMGTAEAEQLLLAAGTRIGLTETECRRTIGSALKAAI